MRTIERLARRGDWLLAALACALVCVPHHALHADEKSDLVGRIEDKLEDAADALERLPDDSDASALDRARAYVYEARRYADELGRIAEDDRDARRIADDFDDHQDDFNEAIGHLRDLKGGQRLHESVATMCSERDKELVRLARDFEAKNDPDGLTELPREAAKVQEATRRQLEDLARHDDKMEDWSDDAQDFSADGPWRELSSTVDQVARATYDRWHRGHEVAQKACENIARGVDHPDVKEVLGKLGNSAGGRKAISEQLDRDARALASALSGVSEDSGMGSVERAKSLLGDIKKGVENLGRSATTDKQTKVILDKWPDGIRQLEAALVALEQLKLHQHDMDPLPDKCKQREQELEDAIKRNGDNTDGVDELPKVADALAAPVLAGIEKAKERMAQEHQDLTKARDVSATEGPWSDIRSAEQRDADETFRTYEDGLEKTTKACENVIKGKNAPRVLAAVADLQKTGQSRDELIKEAEAKIDAAAQLLRSAADKSDDRDIEAALTLGTELAQTLSRLKSAPGANPRAKDILDRWPGYVESYQQALGQVLSLKRAQFELDGMVDQCKRDDQALREFLEQYKDPTGIAPIEARAAAVQAKVKADLDQRRAREAQLTSWSTAAQTFNLSDGKWSYLSGYVRTAAQGSLSHWKKAFEAGQKACNDLSDGVDHPKVQQWIKMLKGRIPPSAAHSADHDRTCVGVPAGGFCTLDDQCLDGSCTGNKCERCPSRDDGRCHPPGTCSQSDYDSRYRAKDEACSKPFNSDSFKGNKKVDCGELEQLCKNAEACLNARVYVQQCFKGGDPRHVDQVEQVRRSLEKCDELLREKRERDLCQ